LLVVLTTCVTAILFISAAPARELAVLSKEIPPQSLARALATCAAETGLQIIYVAEIVGDHRSHGARAGLEPAAALTKLLEGTGLRFEFISARTVRILAAEPARDGAAVRGARAETGAPGVEQEVVVTALALREIASRVPISLAVWTHEEMTAAGIKDFAGLANLTPGVEFDSYSDYGAGLETNVAIRGVNARDGSTTAVYLDDVPLVSDRLSSFGRPFPLTFDLERVEVLRGPQGVLVGEGAEGGAVRFVTSQPSLTEFSGSTRGEYATTARGMPSYELGAAAGGPLVPSRLGFRVSAWSRYDGGYVDRVDPFTGAVVDADANRARSGVASAAFTWAPSEVLEITPGFRHQSVEVHDTSAFYTYLSDPENGILQSGKLLQQPYSDIYSLFSLKAVADVGRTQLEAVAAYLRRHAAAVYDHTNDSGYGWPNPMGPEYPVSYADAKPDPPDLSQEVLSSEVKIGNAQPDAFLRWHAGVQYIHAAYKEFQDVVNSTLADGGSIDGATFMHQYTTRVATYGLVDLRVQARLTATAGIRAERASYHSNEIVGHIHGDDSQQFVFQGSSTPVALHFGLSFQADDRDLYYLTVAKAYRVGGPNMSEGVFCGPTPTSYGPDSVWSTELGAKNGLFDGRLQLNTSVFGMRWHDIQTQIPYCAFGYTTNAGAAQSRGFDFGALAALTSHLSLQLTAAYADARYTQTAYAGSSPIGYPTPATVVATSGDAIGALPLVAAPWTVFASVDYKIAFTGTISATLQAQDVFHSSNPGPFTTENPNATVYAPERQPDPSTNLLNLLASATISRVELSLFLDNALDSQPTLQRRNRTPGDTLFYATTFRPRTLGLAVNWRFGGAAAY
jgi:outer membrane receptor protein involved in Fe transport